MGKASKRKGSVSPTTIAGEHEQRKFASDIMHASSTVSAMELDDAIPASFTDDTDIMTDSIIASVLNQSVLSKDIPSYLPSVLRTMTKHLLLAVRATQEASLTTITQRFDTIVASKDQQISALQAQLLSQDNELLTLRERCAEKSCHAQHHLIDLPVATTSSDVTNVWNTRRAALPTMPSAKVLPTFDNFQRDRVSIHAMPRDLTMSLRHISTTFDAWLNAKHYSYAFELRQGPRGSVILSVLSAARDEIVKLLHSATTDNHCPLLLQPAPTPEADKVVHKLLNFVPNDVSTAELRALLLRDNEWLTALSTQLGPGFRFDVVSDYMSRNKKAALAADASISSTFRCKSVYVRLDVLTNSSLHKQLSSGARLNIDHCSITISDFASKALFQCYQCCGLYHTAANCTAKPSCGKCAGNHATRDCATPNNTCCARCQTAINGGPILRGVSASTISIPQLKLTVHTHCGAQLNMCPIARLALSRIAQRYVS